MGVGPLAESEMAETVPTRKEYARDTESFGAVYKHRPNSGSNHVDEKVTAGRSALTCQVRHCSPAGAGRMSKLVVGQLPFYLRPYGPAREVSS
jgi:hypothetical protein